jgi:hypothetical protein
MASRREMLIEILNYSGFIGGFIGGKCFLASELWAAGRRCFNRLDSVPELF